MAARVLLASCRVLPTNTRPACARSLFQLANARLLTSAPKQHGLSAPQPMLASLIGRGAAFSSTVFRNTPAAAARPGGLVLRAVSGARAFSAAPAVSSEVIVAQQKQVATWLFTVGGMCFGMICLGGYTRLTKSGLSMTDWKFRGEDPPRTEEDWELLFNTYKQFPEYKKVNFGLSMEEFKFIYWTEYSHRMFGRFIGLAVVGPLVYFSARGYVNATLGRKLVTMLAMGASQGFVGWWMVKSGLEEPAEEGGVPRVSPYRLATHLTCAGIIYSYVMWTGLSLVRPNLREKTMELMRVRRIALPLAALIGVTAVSGAFVAGNDAGRAYNTFPLMDGEVIPTGILDMQPVLRNFFENVATVQFQHRCLAVTTWAAASGFWLYTRNIPLPPRVRTATALVAGMAQVQVALGITTLLMAVPVSLGSAHQAGALSLLTFALYLLHAIRFTRAPGAGRVAMGALRQAKAVPV